MLSLGSLCLYICVCLYIIICNTVASDVLLSFTYTDSVWSSILLSPSLLLSLIPINGIYF